MPQAKDAIILKILLFPSATQRQPRESCNIRVRGTKKGFPERGEGEKANETLVTTTAAKVSVDFFIKKKLEEIIGNNRCGSRLETMSPRLASPNYFSSINSCV